MTDTITVRKSTMSEIRSVLRSFTMLCDGCHKFYCDCSLSNELSRAKATIKFIDELRNEKEELFYIDNPILLIKRRIIKAIEQAKRPLRFGEIIVRDVYKQRKYNILRNMVKYGEIKSFIRNSHTFYTLVGNKKQHTKHTKKGHYGI